MYRLINLWKSGWGRALILISIIVVIVSIPAYLYWIRLEIQPVKTAHVEIVNKKTKPHYVKSGGGGFVESKLPNLYVTFRFSDGSEITINIRKGDEKKKTYDSLQKGDTGTLSYKQIKNRTELRHLRFVSFEKD